MELQPFEKKGWLATPTMHGDEIKYVQEVYDSNWVCREIMIECIGAIVT